MARVSGKRRTRDVIAKPAVPGVPEAYNPSEVDRAIDAVASATERVIDKLEPHIGAGGTAHAVATTTAAGFAPALDGDPTHYLDGTGAWSTPASLVTVTGSAAQFLAAILPMAPTAFFVVDVAGYVMTAAIQFATGWIVWSVSGLGYKRTDFDADFAAFAIYDVEAIGA